MSDLIYYIFCSVLIIGVLTGIAMMSKVESSVKGNALSAICTAAAILLTLYKYNILSDYLLWIIMAAGLVAGLTGAHKVKMIEMPETVAMLNGFGGAASALVAIVSVLDGYKMNLFSQITAGLALGVGMITLTGSLVAGGKLHKLLPQKPIVWNGHQAITTISILLTAATIIAMSFVPFGSTSLLALVVVCTVISGFFGIAFAIRVGGADMPITISLLNSLSGVAGSITGMAIADPLLVAIGGVVGASGLLLTQIMCRAMNRSLTDILLGKTSTAAKTTLVKAPDSIKAETPIQEVAASREKENPAQLLSEAKKVILIPGYGMALAQAQSLVRQLADKLEANGTEVLFAIHPVAGRMPGHMNVLLCEVDVPYEKLHEMDEVNPQFADCDVAVIIGANDVVNPAANTAEGTPIYGMPVLDAHKAKHVIICNYDLKPGYAGVENPLYSRAQGVTLLLGDAKETLAGLLSGINTDEPNTAAPVEKQPEAMSGENPDPAAEAGRILSEAKRVILIPGYGMALAQAQSLVKQLADRLEAKGMVVLFAIHPVAGRMPGHMNVLLCEVDVPYEKLHEMDEINPQFTDCDVAVIIGANDVVNPAANTAEGTPIYGMPVLDAYKAKHVIICNYDLKPGYAGVENPLYTKTQDVTLLLGDAKETLAGLMSYIN